MLVNRRLFALKKHLSWVILVSGLSILFAACAGSNAFKHGKKLEQAQNFDEALHYYQKALQADPQNTEYRLRYERARFQAAVHHFDQGRRLKDSGDLESALLEFRQASAIDPSNALAAQEVRAVERMLEERQKHREDENKKLGEMIEKGKASTVRDALGDIKTVPITLKLTGDLKRAYDSIAKVGGLNVIYDPDIKPAPSPLSVDLNNVSVIEALDILSLQTKTYWTAINKNTILVANDTQQTRQTYEEQVIRTFYLGNSLADKDVTETVNMLRMVLNVQKIAPITSQSAIIIRDTPDKIAMVDKILQSIDKAKPEVLIEVAVMEMKRTAELDLGVALPTSTTINLNSPPASSGGTGSANPAGTITLDLLHTLKGSSFNMTFPATTATWLAKQTNARVLQNPSLRAADGKVAKLRIGTKQPVAQGSFQPTFAGNIGGTPVVNFTYIDVGVNLDMTPHVLMNRDITMNVVVEVNAIAGFEPFGGGTSGTVNQPILTQRHIEHDLRLKEGESSVIGGIIEAADSLGVQGIPGLSKIPVLRYFFATNTKMSDEDEIVVVITPHIIRLPEYSSEDFGSLAIIGAGNSPRLIGRPVQLTGDNPPISKGAAPGGPPPVGSPGTGRPAPQPPVTSQPPATEPAPSPQAAPRLAFVRLSSSTSEVAKGSRFAVSAAIENAQNVFALSFNLSFNPKVLKFVEAQNGGFLSSDGTAVAIAPRPDNEAGQAVVSMTRPPESAGMNGRGVLLNFIFEAVAAGVSPINFTQANVRDPSQATLPTSFTGTQVNVK